MGCQRTSWLMMRCEGSIPVRTSQDATTIPGISDTRSNSIGGCIQGSDHESQRYSRRCRSPGTAVRESTWARKTSGSRARAAMHRAGIGFL
jgi:hypothetical protein